MLNLVNEKKMRISRNKPVIVESKRSDADSTNDMTICHKSENEGSLT